MTIGGGFKAVKSVLRYSAKIGPINLWRTVNSKNACKACAFGTGGQNGGIHNEARRGIEICNKNIQAHLSDIRKAIPNTVFFEKSIDELSQLRAKELEDLGRLATPLYKKANDKHYSPISYDEALALISERLQATQPQKSFFYASGRSSNEAAFSLQLLARLYGTNNVNNCSYYCHQASGIGLNNTVGTGTATVRYEDIEKADLIFVQGANPASNHPRFVKALINVRRRGGKVIVINPSKEPGLVKFASPSDFRSMIKGGENIASLYIQPHFGGDIALLQGIAKSILDNEACDTDFIHAHTEHFEAFSQALSALDWQTIEQKSGVPRAEIEVIAQHYTQSQRTIFSWSMGLTHHLHGTGNIEMLAALALMRGMIGKPGSGLMPLRGHSNIQGTGSMGFTPALKKAVHEKLEKTLGHTLPTHKGLDTMACMHASHQGDMDVAIMLGGNLLASNPDTPFATQAMNNIPFKCFISSTINASHVNGVQGEVIVLPIKVRDEEDQSTTQESMFNFVRMSDGGITRFAQLKSEMELICRIGQKLIPKERFDFSILLDYNKVREFIAKVVPGFQKIEAIKQSKEEFHIEGRTLHKPVFNTPTGKAQFKFHAAPSYQAEQYTLASIRSEGQFNSIIYDERDTYRGQKARDVVLMHKEDIKKEGLKTGDRVNLTSEIGCLKNLKVAAFDVRPGNIMTYYPEANVLIPHAVDPMSQTPAFKSVKVRIERQ